MGGPGWSLCTGQKEGGIRAPGKSGGGEGGEGRNSNFWMGGGAPRTDAWIRKKKKGKENVYGKWKRELTNNKKSQHFPLPVLGGRFELLSEGGSKIPQQKKGRRIDLSPHA